MINFIPNDPASGGGVPMRQQAARRRHGKANFVEPTIQEDIYPTGTREFVHWQAHEAACAAVETWEILTGETLTGWATKPQLPLVIDSGIGLNASYDRRTLSFQVYPESNGGNTYIASSTDIVAHEVGHALLDVLRPTLWNPSLFEISAFSEAFGDCVALLTALADSQTRTALLAPTSKLDLPNFVESIGEELSTGYRYHAGPNHNASEPRRACNTFQYVLADNAPAGGGPDIIIAEAHSFSRILTGCFYDLICNIFNQATIRDSNSLWNAAMVAGKLLIATAKSTPPEQRFFQAFGAAMVKEDKLQNQGANRALIGKAFADHNIFLGSSAMLTPIDALEGPAPLPAIEGAPPPARIIAPITVKDLKKRMQLERADRLKVEQIAIGEEKVLSAVHDRPVSLSPLGKEFNGIVTHVPHHATVGVEARSPVLVRPIPPPHSLDREALKFVSLLLEHGHLDLDSIKNPSRRPKKATKNILRPLPTHRIVSRGGKKILERIRFT